MSSFKVGYFVGSLATASINRLLAKALVRLAPPELQMTEIPFKDLPLYSYDYDANYPPVATAFKNAIAAVDAVLFVTPEYNRSIPGALKNAIDWASRPYGTNAFARKPSAVIGTSPGKIGTAVGQQHLRSILAFCNSPLMNSIEAYIQFERGLITEDGQVTNPSVEKFLNKYITEFHGFIARVYMALPRNTYCCGIGGSSSKCAGRQIRRTSSGRCLSSMLFWPLAVSAGPGIARQVTRGPRNAGLPRGPCAAPPPCVAGHSRACRVECATPP